MVSLKKSLKAFIMLLRSSYWLMTGGLSALTMIALQRGLPDTGLLAIVVLSAICITLAVSRSMTTLTKSQMP